MMLKEIMLTFLKYNKKILGKYVQLAKYNMIMGKLAIIVENIHRIMGTIFSVNMN